MSFRAGISITWGKLIPTNQMSSAERNVTYTLKMKVRQEKRKSIFALLRKDGTTTTRTSLQSPRKMNFQQKSVEPQAGVPLDIEKNYRVPLLVRKLFPKLKEKKYSESLSNPTFLEV